MQLVTARPDDTFSPADVRIKVGGVVKFRNTGGDHAVFGGAGIPDEASPVGQQNIPQTGDSVRIRFPKPGIYPFFCIVHIEQRMRGEVVVD